MTARLLVVVGTRPEAIKLAPVVQALQASPWAACRVLATGQHREMLGQALGHFGIAPDRDLGLMRPGQTPAELAARLLAALDPVLADERPDGVLVQGDTSTAFASALACYYRRIPLAHVEAGLRTFDKWRPFPEEGHRGLVARLADLHFAPTQEAGANLLAEGVPAARIHVVGNTVVDALRWTAARVDAHRWRPPAGRRLLLATAHRRESIGAPLAQICRALRALAARPDVQLLLPLHPNPAVRAIVEPALRGLPQLRLCEPLDYPDLVAALQAASLVLTDSGGLQEEAAALGRPVLVLRGETDRPEGVRTGAARIAGTDAARIEGLAAALLDDPAALAAMAAAPNPYGEGRSAAAIAAVLQRCWGR